VVIKSDNLRHLLDSLFLIFLLLSLKI
jgi:hypothetical protein